MTTGYGTPGMELGGGRVPSEPGSHPSGHAASGVDGAPRFDPSRGLHILQHSLGVDQFGQGNQYRNHFVTGEGSTDYPDCQALVGAGLMVRQKGGQLTGGMDAFFVTQEGKRYVAENSPPPPKLTRDQRRYREWLNVSDVTGESFIEFCQRDSDRSGEAGETGTGSTVGESAGRDSGIAQTSEVNND